MNSIKNTIPAALVLVGLLLAATPASATIVYDPILVAQSSA